jgi:capsular exopolysaccharide synthesis family protein
MNASRDDPRSYLKLLWRWRLLFVAFVVGVPLATFLYASQLTKVYQSSVLLDENLSPVDTSLFTSSGGAAPSTSSTIETIGGLAQVIDTLAVARVAALHLHPPPANPASLLGAITATGDVTTGFITVDARAGDPQRAADIANAFGDAVVTLRTRQAIALLNQTINQVTSQLAQMHRGDAVGRKQLSSQLQRLRALRAAQGANAQVLQAAVPDTTPVSPRIPKIVGLGLLAGLLLGFGAVFIAEASDGRIRHPEDLEELTGLRLLAVVPRDAFTPGRGGPGANEAFHLLRSALMFFSVDRPLSTIVISSPVKEEGKTMVATQLAVAAAEMGREVILVDADLRRPAASSRLGITGESVKAGHGLAGVLTGQATLDASLVDVELGDPGVPGEVTASSTSTRRRLRVLPAGGTPPNPSELIASQRMRELLTELAGIADLVVIDTNPLLSVSDSLPLIDSVSGVVLVARLNSTTKAAIKRLQSTIANTDAQVLGVVATGAQGGLMGRYGYGYGYSARYAGANGNGNGNGNGHANGNGNGNGNGRRGLAGRLDRRRADKHPT